tara:strand:- start:713 stop:823 length:111 start_codon:yes stop_codon:yes gene_type:complete
MKKPNQIRDSETFTTIGIIGVGVMIVIAVIIQMIYD